MSTAQQIVQHMMDHDAFSKWLGIEVIDVEAGSATLRMTVREEMTNGFGIAHGGISYSLADSALAFASNGGGNQSVSLETAIHHLKPVQSGDTLEARATLLNETRRTGLYQIDIFKDDVRVAFFKGTVYRTGNEWNL